MVEVERDNQIPLGDNETDALVAASLVAGVGLGEHRPGLGSICGCFAPRPASVVEHLGKLARLTQGSFELPDDPLSADTELAWDVPRDGL